MKNKDNYESPCQVTNCLCKKGLQIRRYDDGIRRRGAIGFVILSVILTSCSITKHLPVGEQLYTGIRGIVIIDKDSIEVSDELLDQIDEVLACPPSNALLGSSTTRVPFNFGIWVFQKTAHKKDAFNRWITTLLATKPVYISTVKPETRTKNVYNILRDNGFFNGKADFEVIPENKDSLKAKIRYEITFNEPYTIDSVEWRRMQSRADTILIMNEAERLIRSGDRFNAEKLEAERQRIAMIMRNNGYYYFRTEYIGYQADSTLSPYKISLRASLKQGVPRSILRPWHIGDISVILGGYDNEMTTDSVRYNDLMIYYEGKLRVRPKIIADQLKFERGDLYSALKQGETQTALNRLDIFRYTDFQYMPKDTSLVNDTLHVRINTSFDYPITASFEAKATSNDNHYAGPGVSLNLNRRNLFGGGETLTGSLYGSYEWNTGRATIKNAGFINNYEIGARGDIMFPRLVLPKIGKRAYDFSAVTHLDMDVHLSNRANYYSTWNIGGRLSYEFHPTTIRHHTFTPFRLIFNQLSNTTQAFDSIVSKNPTLRQSLQNQFIPSIGYSYTLGNPVLSEGRNKTLWTFAVTEAGHLVSGVYAIFGERFSVKDKSIMGNPYAQFLKITTELRYNRYINRSSRLATRLGGGVIYSYGNSVIAPYAERFYIGGANSIRAFTIRSIGPGRFRPDPDNPYAYIDQNGDWKIEGNIEYRSNLVGSLDYALFLDAGNVWLMRNDNTRPGGTFHLKHLFNDIAVGTGIGFRYDMEMLIFRIDIGYAIHYPYDTYASEVGKKRYFNTPSFRDALGIHLALGYPF